MDKLYHLLVGIILGGAMLFYFYKTGKGATDSIWASLFIVLCIAVGKEIYDIEYGTVDLFDILYTLLGGWVGNIIIVFYLHNSK